MPFTVAKTIISENWNEQQCQKAKTFWEKRNMRFSQEGDVLVGKRGSLGWNLITSDPMLMFCTLTITSLESSKIDCILKVSQFFQAWTIWDQTAFELEMAIFENFMTSENSMDDLWRRYLRAYQTHYWMATISFGLLGMTMSKSERSEFRAPLLLKSTDLNCLTSHPQNSSH